MRHPNIVGVYEAGEHQAVPFLAMEYVEGRSLGEMTLQQQLPPEKAATYVRQIAEAVQYAHRMGILHRDLKPANILVDAEDQPRISDFGLAKRSGDDSELTRSGQTIGSPCFMPPEQACFCAERIGPWSDVFSLGAIFYQLVTGRPPFLAGSLSESLQNVLYANPVSPRLLNPRLPKDLETIILKSLEKEPSKRYSKASELADECGRFLRDEPILARPTGRVIKLSRWCRRNPSLATLGAAVVLLLLTITLGSVASAWKISKANQATQIEFRKRRHSLYVGNMNVARDAYSSGNLRQSLNLLEENRPLRGAEDFRGFEWRYLWKLCQGTAAFRYSLPAFQTGSLHFFGESRVLALLNQDRRVTMRDLPDATTLWQIALGQDRATAVALAPDGKALVTAGSDLRLRTWDLTVNPPRLAAEEAIEVPIPFLAYSRDGRSVIWVAENGLVRRRSQESGHGSEEGWLPVEPGLKDVLAVSSDLRTFALREAGSHGVLLWSFASEPVLLSSPGLTSSTECAAFSSDGRYLATGSSGGRIRLWDLPSRKPLGVLEGHRSVATFLVFSHDRRTLASCSLDNTIKLWDMTSRANFATLKGHLEPVISLTFSSDDLLLASLSFDQTVRIWKVDPDENQTPVLEHTTGVYACAFSPAGRWLAAVGADGALLLWDTEARSRVGLIQAAPEDAGYMLRFTFDGSRLLTQGVTAEGIKIWDPVAGKQVGEIAIQDTSIYDWDLLPDTNVVVAGSADGRVVLVDLLRQQQLKSFHAHDAPVNSVAVAPDGDRLATVAGDGAVKIWAVHSFAMLAETATPANAATRVLFFPDGEMLLTTHWDGSAQVWSTESLRKLSTFKPDYFYAVTISPDGRNIAFGCADQTLRVWNLAAIGGDLLVQKAFYLSGHRSVVGGVSFSPDGNTLASCSEDQSVRLWSAPSLFQIDHSLNP